MAACSSPTAARMEGDRGYQRFCFSRALEENVICALPTGAGKTRVAIRLLQACQDMLGLPTKAAIFLCPSVALCMQQADVAAASGLKVALLASGSVVDLEKKRLDALNTQQASKAADSSIAPSDIEIIVISSQQASEAVPAQHAQHKRRRIGPEEVEGSYAPSVSVAPSKASTGTNTTKKGPVHQLSNKLRAGAASREHVANVLREVQLVVATPGELLACLTHALITVHNIALVILDEAHHCSANHAYAQLLDNFLVVLPVEKRPRLLGLTATPLQILERPAPGTGGRLCSLEVIANARVIGAPDWSEVERLVPKPKQRLLFYKQPPTAQHPVLGPFSQHLDAAQRLLATVQALHKHRAIIKQSLRLVRARDAAAAVVADAGRVHSGGHTVFEYLAREVAAIQNSLHELGLWAALLVTQHTLLSSNQSSLIMALDPEFQLDDDDDSDTEHDAGAQKALDVGLQLPSMSASLQLQGDLARLRAERDKLRKRLRRRVHANEDRPPPDSELEQMASKLAVQMVMDALGEAVESALGRVSSGQEEQHALDVQQLAIDVYDGLWEHGLRGLMEGKLAHLVPRWLLPDNEHVFRLWRGTQAPPPRGPVWHLKGRDTPPEKQPESVSEGIWFTDKLRKLMHLVMNPRPNISRGPLSPSKVAAANGTAADANGTAAADINAANGDKAVAGAATVASGSADAATRSDGPSIQPEQTMVFFAQKVYTVVVDQLVKLLPEAKQAGLISCCFMGDTGSGSLSLPLSMGLNAQRRVMTAFRTGTVNLLLATHVGAEGLDFGCCSRVVLMDIPPHVVQLTQCKGRARLPGSECVLLVPESDLDHKRQLEELNRIEVAMTQAIIKRTAEYIMEKGLTELIPTITTNMGPPPPRPPLSQRAGSTLITASKTFGSNGATEGWDAAEIQSERSRSSVHGPWDVVTETVVVSSADVASNPVMEESVNDGGSMVLDDVAPVPAGNTIVAMDVDTASELASVADASELPEEEVAAAIKDINVELLEELPQTLVVHTTGATCTLDYAEQVLQRYCNALPGNDEFVQLQVVTLVKAFEGGAYQATIALPSNAHAGSNNHAQLTVLRTFRGPRCNGRKTAKAAACLLAVQTLYAEQLLDGYLLPASLSSQLQRGQWGAVGQVAARIINNEIQGYMPMLKLPHKLADILKVRVWGSKPSSQAPGTKAAHRKHVRPKRLLPGGPTATAAADATHTAAATAAAAADVITLDITIEDGEADAVNRAAKGVGPAAAGSPVSQDTDVGMDEGDQDHQHDPQQQDDGSEGGEEPGASMMQGAPEPSVISANAVDSTPASQHQHAPAGGAASSLDGPVVRHLCGWWIQVTDMPSHAQRGAFGSDVYSLDGPWPCRHVQQISASPHPSTKAMPAGKNSGLQAAAGTQHTNAQAQKATYKTAGIHPMLIKQMGDSWLHPYGMLLVNKLPADALPPFSVWLPGKQHALVACVHLAEIQLTPLQLSVMQASHACLHKLATAAAPKPKPKSNPAGASAGKDGKQQPAKAAMGQAGKVQAAAPANAAAAVGAAGVGQQPRPMAVASQGVEADEVQSAPPPAPRVKLEPEEEEPPEEVLGLHPHLSKVVGEVNRTTGARKLQEALKAMQAGTANTAAFQKDDALADNWYLLTPVTVTDALAAAGSLASASSTSASSANTAAPLGPGTKPPRVSGDIDWTALAQLAGGVQAVQQMVDLGPFALTAGADQGNAGRPPQPTAHTAMDTTQDMYGGSIYGGNPYGGGLCGGSIYGLAAAAALSNAAYGGVSADPFYESMTAANKEAAAKVLIEAVLTRLDTTLHGRIVMPFNNPFSRYLYAAPAMKEPMQAVGSNATAAQCTTTTTNNAAEPQPELITLQSNMLASTAPSSTQSGSKPSYRTCYARQYRALPVAALPDCTPLANCLLGTGDYIRRDYTQPPSGQKQRRLRQAYRTKDTPATATAAQSNADGQPAGEKPTANVQAAEARPTAAEKSGQQAAPAPAAAANSAAAPLVSPVQAAAQTALGPVDMETAPAAKAIENPASGPGAATTTAAAAAAAATKHDLVLPEWVLRRSRPEQLLPAALLVHPLDLVEWGALTATPSLVHRMKACIAVHEFREALKTRVQQAQAALPELRDLLACVTAASANEAFSSEGAELLGDSVMDYLAAAYLFHYLPEQHEGVLTECKVRLVANEVLLRLTEPDSSRRGAISVPIQPYVQARAFDRQWEWEVGCKASGNTRMKQARSGKLVADCLEAVVGAAFLHAGGTEALKLLTDNSSTSCHTVTAHNHQAADTGHATAASSIASGAHGDAAAPRGAMTSTIVEQTVSCQNAKKQAQMVGPGVECPIQHIWDSQKLTAALLSSARFCHETGILPGSYDILAAIHDAEDAPPEARARVHAAQARTPASARLQMRDLRLAQALSPLLGGYQFRRPELLREALTHCSYHRPPCNQRLEFLGDAALDMVVTCQLVAACAHHAATFSARQLHVRGVSILDPGLITEKRNRLVSNKHLSILCVRSGLHRFLRVGLPAVRALISKFETGLPQFQEEDDRQLQLQEKAIAEAAEKGEVYVIQRHKYGQSTGAPKLLADVVEAVLGAVMVDACGDLAQVWAALWGLVERADMQHHYAWSGASITAVDKALAAELQED